MITLDIDPHRPAQHGVIFKRFRDILTWYAAVCGEWLRPWSLRAKPRTIAIVTAGDC
jgi:hypothetical protein